MRQRNQPLDVILLPEKADIIAHAQVARQDLGRPSVGPVTHHQQVSGRRLSHAFQNMDAVIHAFHRAKIRKVDEQLFAVGRIPHGSRFLHIRFVGRDVDEVGDHAHAILHAKNLSRALADEFADAGDAVRLLDGEFGDGKIGAVRTHERNVGSMQRGDERQPAHQCQHLLRQQCRDRVRNRVMHVQQVERVALGHFRHARRQRQAVRRILEQRVIRDFDLVIVDARRPRIEPDGIGVGDEVNIVPAVGQLETQLSSDNAAAAIGGITGDADLHFISVAFGTSSARPRRPWAMTRKVLFISQSRHRMDR